jgi:hypothetical protein
MVTDTMRNLRLMRLGILSFIYTHKENENHVREGNHIDEL